MKSKKFDLNDRLIDFAVFTLTLTDTMYNSRAGNHIANQLVRSCTSPALQYGEALSAESTKDFIHKLKILLKELRESFNSLKIAERVPLTEKTDMLKYALSECSELIAIFVKSIETTRKNQISKGTTI
ncbi:MAG: four helix bundle protein [Bacteroidota bacterium]